MNEKAIRVYEEIADKELSFGCMVQNIMSEQILYFAREELGIYDTFIGDSTFVGDEKLFTIIGKPLHYGYAVDWLEKNTIMKTVVYNRYEDFPEDLLGIFWKDKKLPIEHPENIEALDYFDNLLELGQI